MRLGLADLAVVLAIAICAAFWWFTGEKVLLFTLGIFVGGFAFRLGYGLG